MGFLRPAGWWLRPPPFCHRTFVLIASIILILCFPSKAGRSFVIDKVKIPPNVILGQTVHLYCLFTMKNGTDIYTLKWFKDGKEFYRAVPRAQVRLNRRLVFPLPGVKVDFENSKIISTGTHQLALLGVTLETTGYYTCQITMDAPPFEFLEQSGHLRVISLPERFPVISGHKLGHDYRLGDWVNLNCTCFDSYPAATLKWFINGNEVEDSYLIRYLPTKSTEEEGLESATLGLSYEVTDFHFAPTVHPGKREMWVRCEATMPPIEGMTFPFTREVFLGTFVRSFDRYHASSSASSSTTSTTTSQNFFAKYSLNVIILPAVILNSMLKKLL